MLEMPYGSGAKGPQAVVLEDYRLQRAPVRGFKAAKILAAAGAGHAVQLDWQEPGLRDLFPSAGERQDHPGFYHPAGYDFWRYLPCPGPGAPFSQRDH